jgi:hypothetical protein
VDASGIGGDRKELGLVLECGDADGDGAGLWARWVFWSSVGEVGEMCDGDGGKRPGALRPMNIGDVGLSMNEWVSFPRVGLADVGWRCR